MTLEGWVDLEVLDGERDVTINKMMVMMMVMVWRLKGEYLEVLDGERDVTINKMIVMMMLMVWRLKGE